MPDILCIEKKQYLELEESGKKDPATIIALASLNPKWIPRDQAEQDENYLQIIPYIILSTTVKNTQYVFMYERLKKGNEKRLHTKTSIGIGGHIDRYPEYDSLHIEEIIDRSCFRELSEEVDCLPELTERNSINYLGVIYDPTEPVGRVHIGLLGIVALEPESSVEAKEKEKIAGKLVKLDSLRNKDNFSRLENWSKMACTENFVGTGKEYKY